MQDFRSPLSVLIALRRMMPILPDLVGSADWPEIEAEINTKVDALQRSKDKTDQIKLSMNLVSLLLKYPKATDRLQIELGLQRLVLEKTQQQLPQEIRKHASNRNQVEAALVIMQFPLEWTLADDISLDDLKRIVQLHDERIIWLQDSELTEGKSIKLKNFEFNFSEMVQLVTGTFLATFGLNDQPRPIMIAGAILTMIATLLPTITIQFSEQETSVFWGLIQSQGMDFVSEDEILCKTNNMRTKHFLPPLNETELRRSLKKLTNMKCVARRKVGDTSKWRIVEKYKIT